MDVTLQKKKKNVKISDNDTFRDAVVFKPNPCQPLFTYSDVPL
jgi:hypothetical protein